MHHATKRGFKDCPGFLNSTGRLGPRRGRKCYITPAFSGVPNKGNKIRTQNLRRGGTLMHHATKRGFKDCPGFLNSTGQNWPTCGQTGYVTPVVSGIPTAIELGAESELAHLWARWLHNPCRLGDPHRLRAGGRIRKRPTSGQDGYITPLGAFGAGAPSAPVGSLGSYL